MTHVPTHVDPRWKTLKSATKIDIEALFLLRDDRANYNSLNQPPFVVLSNGECFNTPKYMWRIGHECIQHLHRFQAPDIGNASLKAWLEAILESEDPLSPIQVGILERETLHSEDETDASKASKAGNNAAPEECEQKKIGEPAGDDSLTLHSETPQRDTRKRRKKKQRMLFLKRWRLFCRQQ